MGRIYWARRGLRKEEESQVQVKKERSIIEGIKKEEGGKIKKAEKEGLIRRREGKGKW